MIFGRRKEAWRARSFLNATSKTIVAALPERPNRSAEKSHHDAAVSHFAAVLQKGANREAKAPHFHCGWQADRRGLFAGQRQKGSQLRARLTTATRPAGSVIPREYLYSLAAATVIEKTQRHDVVGKTLCCAVRWRRESVRDDPGV